MPNSTDATMPVLRSPTAITHVFGEMVDDWRAADIWLREVAASSRSAKQQTIATYNQHLQKIRWYCEHVAHKTPSSWLLPDVQRFREFLTISWPIEAECRRREPPDRTHVDKLTAFVRAGEPGWTPFQRKPSAAAAADLLRFLKGMYTAWLKAGYIHANPMGLSRISKDRNTETSRAIPLDLYALVLGTIMHEESHIPEKRRLAARDRFVFEALRELGLRASEFIGASMNAFQHITIPKSGERYWVFYVARETAKGSKSRYVPVTRAIMDAFSSYRIAFGMSPTPAPDESTPLLLSPRTNREDGFGKRSSAQTRRYFRAWKPITTRQGLYVIVTGRLHAAATILRNQQRLNDAERLEAASPHWLRHTFGKAALLAGQNVREVAGALGHADLGTVMTYTVQEAIDLIAAWEREQPGMLARERAAA